jgi:hypothetical protein
VRVTDAASATNAARAAPLLGSGWTGTGGGGRTGGVAGDHFVDAGHQVTGTDANRRGDQPTKQEEHQRSSVGGPVAIVIPLWRSPCEVLVDALQADEALEARVHEVERKRVA